MAFNPPNPYGSYFNFGDIDSMLRSASLPGMSAGPSPGVSAAMGVGSAGFNPTADEFSRNRYRDIAIQQFLARSLSEDPRTSVFGNMALRSMFGNDNSGQQELIRRMGGRSSFNEMIGFMLNMPGVSGYLGGSQRSLGIGALAATTGMRINGSGYGMFGDNPFQIMAAQNIMQNVQKTFYSPSGAANLSATSGLNRDQIGGIMMTGGLQGAFAGLNFGQMANVAGKPQLVPDSASMQKITEFTKKAAKAVGDLIDVFGDSSVADLLSKAQQITGLDLSRMGNAGVIGQRLDSLRRAAQATGQDVQSMYDTAAGARQVGMGMGLSSAGAGAIATMAAVNAGFRSREAMGGFYMAGTSQNEFAAAAVRDSVGMLRDPLGARRSAIELMIQEGRISGSDAGSIRARMSDMGPQNMPALDAEVQRKYGVSLTGYIRSQGGADRVYEQLDEGGKSSVLQDQQGDSNRRAETYMRRMYVLQNGTKGLTQMMSLMQTFGRQNLQTLLAKADAGGSMGDLTAIAANDFGGAGNPSGFAITARQLSGLLGGRSAAAAQGLAHAMSNPNTPFTMGYKSLSDQMNQADSYFKNAPTLAAGVRGGMRGGLLQGILEKADGRDPASVFAMMAAVNPESIAGLSPDRRLSVNAADFRGVGGGVDLDKFRTQAQIMNTEFKRTAEGRRLLASLGINDDVMNNMSQGKNSQVLLNAYQRWTNPMWREKNMKGFSPFNFSDGGMAFALSDDTTRLSSGVGMNAMALARVGQMLKAGGDRTAFSENLERAGLEVLSGREYKMNRDTRRFYIANGRKFTDKELTSTIDTLNRLGTNPDLANRLNEDQVRALGAAREYGQSAMDSLTRMDISLMGVKGETAAKKLAAVRKKEDVLSQLGFVGKVEGVSRIVGTLKMLPDKSGFEFMSDSKLVGGNNDATSTATSQQ